MKNENKKLICSCCKKEAEDPNEYIKGPIRSIMEKENCCFSCAFWKEKLNIFKDDEKWCIVDGISYHIKDFIKKLPNGSRIGIGSGGKTFYIKKKDGILFKSNNVWCQGYIPNHFKELIPDNAEFISKEEYEKFINNEK